MAKIKNTGPFSGKEKVMKAIKALAVCLFAGTLVACGGGGSDSKSQPPTTQQPDPAPTLATTQENERCEVAKECLLLSGEVSKNATGVTLSLDGVDSAVVEVAGTRTDVASDGSVSFSASKSFKVFVTHATVETLTVGISTFTVDGKDYSSTATAEVEFFAPAANATIDLASQECGNATCDGTLYADTPIDSATFTLEAGVKVTLKTAEGSYTSNTDGVVNFPATSQADVSFAIDGNLSVQQVSRVTTNSLDSVTVSGNSQTVNESYELSYAREVNTAVSLAIATIYGGANVTTDISHEKKAVKQVVQYGPGIEFEPERAVLENVTFSFQKWSIENNDFEVVTEGTITNAQNLTLGEANQLTFYADTTPWVYRVQVTGEVSGDTLSSSLTFVKREENSQLGMLLFPTEVTAERVAQLHQQYDALEEGAEFSSTLANLYPREYMDPDGNLQAVDCTYTWTFNDMFPSMSSTANVKLLSYCNQITQFGSALTETETSMMLNIRSDQHDDLVEIDYSMPRSSIDINYKARQGSNVVDLNFHSFASPGNVKMSLNFTTPNTSSTGNLITFDVASDN
jgi:hypothetical protein